MLSFGFAITKITDVFPEGNDAYNKQTDSVLTTCIYSLFGEIVLNRTIAVKTKKAIS